MDTDRFLIWKCLTIHHNCIPGRHIAGLSTLLVQTHDPQGTCTASPLVQMMWVARQHGRAFLHPADSYTPWHSSHGIDVLSKVRTRP